MSASKKKTQYFDEDSDSSDSEGELKLTGSKRRRTEKDDEPKPKRRKISTKTSSKPSSKVDTAALELKLNKFQHDISEKLDTLVGEIAKWREVIGSNSIVTLSNKTMHSTVFESHDPSEGTFNNEDFVNSRMSIVTQLEPAVKNRLLNLINGMNAFNKDPEACLTIYKNYLKQKQLSQPSVEDKSTSPSSGNVAIDLRLYLHLNQTAVGVALGTTQNCISRLFRDFLNTPLSKNSSCKYSWPSRTLDTAFTHLNNQRSNLQDSSFQDEAVVRMENSLLAHVVSPITVSLKLPPEVERRYNDFSFAKLENGVCPELYGLWIDPAKLQ